MEFQKRLDTLEKVQVNFFYGYVRGKLNKHPHAAGVYFIKTDDITFLFSYKDVKSIFGDMVTLCGLPSSEGL